ncbi:HAD family hydrolase [Brevibacillus choshinensis]|uniref:HAD family hydrolase n=1 Tax=Brevibacillus choshinensis TaxID=54911 RepID=UPI002E1F5FC4|nr:HAD family hydrolase [Brevibacillus choshinensis]
MNIKRWITFDLDGTLMQNPFGAWVFPEIAEMISGILGRPHDVVSEMVVEHDARMRGGRYVEAYDWDDILRERFRELGIPDSIEIEPLVRKHSVPPKVKLLESGILELLSDLKARGYFLAAVTNGFYKFQAPVMEALGLIDKFDEVVTPERAGAGKPDPAILRGLGGQIIAHVGDRLDHDVQLANRCNVAAILIHKNLTADLKSLSPLLRVKEPAGIQLCIEKARKETKNALWNELTAGLVPVAIIDSLHEIPVILDA